MKSIHKKPYEAASLTFVSFSCEDIMTVSAEGDSFFFGDLDSFISNALSL